MTNDIVDELRDRACSFKAPDPLMERAADEIERLRDAMDAGQEEVAWRTRDSVEFLPINEWVGRAAAEIDRLRIVIDTYVGVTESGAKEINALRHERDRLAAELVHKELRITQLLGVAQPMPEIPKFEET